MDVLSSTSIFLPVKDHKLQEKQGDRGIVQNISVTFAQNLKIKR
jgi:hypothetical protein